MLLLRSGSKDGLFRTESFSRKVAKLLLKSAPKTVSVEVLEVANFPLSDRERFKDYEVIVFSSAASGISPSERRGCKPVSFLGFSLLTKGEFEEGLPRRQAMAFFDTTETENLEGFRLSPSQISHQTDDLSCHSTREFLTQAMDAFVKEAAPNARN